jgi:hypothetical protein
LVFGSARRYSYDRNTGFGVSRNSAETKFPNPVRQYSHRSRRSLFLKKLRQPGLRRIVCQRGEAAPPLEPIVGPAVKLHQFPNPLRRLFFSSKPFDLREF